MKNNARPVMGILLTICLLATPLTALAKKGDKNFKKGLAFEAAQQWERAAQEFTLAVAANPSDTDYQLHYRRAVFNASQAFMQKGRALSDQKDYIGAFNAFRQAYAYDPVNQLALSEMDRMQRLQREKTGEPAAAPANTGNDPRIRPTSYDTGNGQNPGRRPPINDNSTPATEPLRIINYNGDLKNFIRQLADQLGLNVIFDSQSFRQPRTIEINLKDVTTAQALDWLFLQEGLFFQKLSRRTVLVADQNRRPQYQELVIRTFYLSNTDPNDARQVITQAIPPQQGRPQTIVIVDKTTNSLTVRDTAENVLLISDILKSLDKDRAEVVMDVNIYEVSNTDLLQLGNQIGDANSLANLGGSRTNAVTFGGVSQALISGATAATSTVVPGAFGGAFLLPQATLSALQSKDHTRLVASTQVHAFSGEESTARIGQRVPVQTAQTYPYGTSTPTTGAGTTPGIFTGGFPVIQYEPTGLTLKFTPQVFPNQDVQVKMSIESKDVLGASSLTPTFTERTITGTARIQNNRTMMLASVAQDKQSNGRTGIPLLGLVPILGRFVTAPKRDNQQTDIVIAVTPRVLRAPAITPDDEQMRKSGTLQTPTTGSLEALVQEANHEDQLAAARKIGNNVVVQLPDVEVAAYVPAPKTLVDPAATTPAKQENPLAAVLSSILPSAIGTPTSSSLVNNVATSIGQPPSKLTPTSVNFAPSTISGTGSSTIAEKLAAATAGVDKNPVKPAEAIAKVASPANNSNDSNGSDEPPPLLSPVVPVGTAELRLVTERSEFKVGERQRIGLVLSSTSILGPAVIRLKFDAAVISVRGLSQGDNLGNAAPALMQSIDPSGSVMLAISPGQGSPIKVGSSILLYFDVEAVGAGEASMAFERENIHLVGLKGEEITLKLGEAHLAVKK